MKSKIPIWIMIYGGLLALQLISNSALQYTMLLGELNPFLMPPLGIGALRGQLGTSLSRIAAMGIVMAVALLRRSPQMLIALFLLRSTTGMIDFIHRLLVGDSFFPAFLLFALLLWLPSAWAIRTLWSIDTSR